MIYGVPQIKNLSSDLTLCSSTQSGNHKLMQPLDGGGTHNYQFRLYHPTMAKRGV